MIERLSETEGELRRELESRSASERALREEREALRTVSPPLALPVLSCSAAPDNL